MTSEENQVSLLERELFQSIKPGRECNARQGGLGRMGAGLGSASLGWFGLEEQGGILLEQ